MRFALFLFASVAHFSDVNRVNIPPSARVGAGRECGHRRRSCSISFKFERRIHLFCAQTGSAAAICGMQMNRRNTCGEAAAVGSSSSASEATRPPARAAECARHKRRLHSVNVSVSLAAVDINDRSKMEETLSELAGSVLSSTSQLHQSKRAIKRCNSAGAAERRRSETATTHFTFRFSFALRRKIEIEVDSLRTRRSSSAAVIFRANCRRTCIVGGGTIVSVNAITGRVRHSKQSHAITHLSGDRSAAGR